MGGKQLPIYRLPIPTATRVGQIRVVRDRHGKIYVNGQTISETTSSGGFTTIVSRDGSRYFVKTSELENL